MAEAPTTTRPARTRKPAATTAAKTAPAKSATPKEPVNVTRFKVELEHGGATKSYEKFSLPDSYKGTVVGSVYAPLGTARVVVWVIGADDEAANTED